MNDKIKTYTDKKGNKLFRFQIYLGKKKTTGTSIYVRKRGFKSREEAENAYNAILELKEKGTYQAKKEKRYKVCDLAKLWLKGYKGTVRESTYASTLIILNNHILKDLGSFYLDSLTVPMCMEATEKWSKEAPKSVKKFMGYTNTIFNKGVKWHMMAFNPMSDVDCPKVEYPVKPFNDYYTKEELERFLDCAKKTQPLKIYTFFRLLAYSGMRRGEALALTWEDVNFFNKTININKTVAQGKNNRLMIDNPKTKKGIRLLDMDTETMKVLMQWKKTQREDMFKLGFNTENPKQLVFSTITTNGLYQPARVAEWNNKICKQNNLRHIKVHGFRHTHATLFLAAGGTMEDVKARLGHSKITTTMDIYAHMTESRKKKVADIFAKYMGTQEM